MIKALMAKEWRQLRWVWVIGGVLCLVTAVLTVAFYGTLGQMIEEIPPEVLDVLLRYDAGQQLLTLVASFDVYLWSQWNAKNMIQLGSLFVIIIATMQFAQEAGKKTMGFYLTRPISRREGLAGKMLSGLMALGAVFGAGTLALILLSRLFGYDVPAGRFLVAFLVGFCWMAVFYALAVRISIGGLEPVLSAVITAAVGLGLSLPIFAGSWRVLSIFYQMRAGNYYLQGQNPLWSVSAALILFSLLTLLNIRAFSRKDY